MVLCIFYKRVCCYTKVRTVVDFLFSKTLVDKMLPKQFGQIIIYFYLITL